MNQNEISVSDLNSSNGIYLATRRTSSFSLKQAGEFQVGDLLFKVNLEVPLESKIIKEPHGHSDWRRLDFALAPDPDAQNLKLREMALQGTVTWHDEIYDVRNFNLNEPVKLGPNRTEPLYVPIINGELDLGVFRRQGAYLSIPKNFKWKLYREISEIPKSFLITSGHVRDAGHHLGLTLALNEVVSIDIGFGMNFRLRYVPLPHPLIKKTWIENRDEYRRAITISLGVHLFLSTFAMILAPKAQGPTVGNMAPRFARLLIEPPKQTFAFEPPPPPAPPPPPPPPPEEEPKPLVEKKEPKVVTKKEIAKEIVKKAERARPVVKAEPKKVESEKAQSPLPSKEPSQTTEAQEMANLFGAMPTPGGGKGFSKGLINIQKGSGAATKTGVRVGGLAVSNGGSGGRGEMTGLGLGSEAGMAGYAQAKNSKAGKQGIAGAVVGKPTFSGVKAEQGIDNDAVMKVVNSHLSDIHRCYERALFKDANVVGRVEYEWEISAKGTVSSVSVKRSEVSNGDFLNSCVMELFKKMKFPEAKNGQTTTANIGFPFGKN